jgi:hypothetical protein
MTPMEAWSIIQGNLLNHYIARRALHPNGNGFTEAEIEAETICFLALKEMQERNEQK